MSKHSHSTIRTKFRHAATTRPAKVYRFTYSKAKDLPDAFDIFIDKKPLFKAPVQCERVEALILIRRLNSFSAKDLNLYGDAQIAQWFSTVTKAETEQAEMIGDVINA